MEGVKPIHVDALIERATRERQTRKRRESTRRMYSFDGLISVRCFMRGPKWKRTFGVREVPIAEVAPESAPYHRPERKLLIFSLEEDVRELVFVGREEIRPGVYAEW